MDTKKKIYLNMASIITLFSLLAVITYALFYFTLTIEDNFFETGFVKINFNNGERVFDENDLALAPGDSIKKPMTIKNIGTGSIYYRIFLENVDGNLKDAIVFNIYDEGVLVKTVVTADFTFDNAFVSDVSLDVDEQKDYMVEAVMSSDAGNNYRDNYITFDFIARAVQSKNNPDKEFE